MKNQLIIFITGLAALIIGIMNIVNLHRAPVPQNAIDFGLGRLGCFRLAAGAVLIGIGLWLLWTAIG